jgi:hypothetical protein
MKKKIYFYLNFYICEFFSLLFTDPEVFNYCQNKYFNNFKFTNSFVNNRLKKGKTFRVLQTKQQIKKIQKKICMILVVDVI